MNQILAIAWNNLLALPARAGSLVVMIVGVASIVAVITGMLALAEGLADSIGSVPSDNRALVLSENAEFIGESSLTDDHFAALLGAPGIGRTAEGRPAVAPDVQAYVALRGRDDGVLKGVVVRGMSQLGLTLRPEIRLVEGRMFTPGLFEAIVGRKAQSQFQRVEVGDRVLLDSSHLDVVGVFETGNWLESGFIVDAQSLLTAAGRRSANAALVRLASPEDAGRLREALESHAALELQVLTEPEYYERLLQAYAMLDRVVAFIGLIVSIGGICCVLNVMYASVSARDTEIATYRALGFRSGGVVVSVVLESLLVALLGALIGAATTWFFFDGLVVTTGSKNASVVHELTVSAGVVTLGILAALGIAFVGSLAPAINAARIPMTRTTRLF